ESNVSESYRLARLLRKLRADIFDRVARKAATREAAQRLRVGSSCVEESPGAVDLRLERRDRLDRRLRRDQTLPQVCPDRGVAVAAARQLLGACLREP